MNVSMPVALFCWLALGILVISLLFGVLDLFL